MENKCKQSLKLKAQNKYKRVRQKQTVNESQSASGFEHNRVTPLYVITTSNVFLPFTGFALCWSNKITAMKKAPI